MPLLQPLVDVVAFEPDAHQSIKRLRKSDDILGFANLGLCIVGVLFKTFNVFAGSMAQAPDAHFLFLNLVVRGRHDGRGILRFAEVFDARGKAHIRFGI